MAGVIRGAAGHDAPEDARVLVGQRHHRLLPPGALFELQHPLSLLVWAFTVTNGRDFPVRCDPRRCGNHQNRLRSAGIVGHDAPEYPVHGMDATGKPTLFLSTVQRSKLYKLITASHRRAS